MSTLTKPKRLNVMETARPGIVGSVGDALITPQLATSDIDMPPRFEKGFYNRPDNGSIISMQPYVYDSSWNMGRGERTAYGLVQQDLRAPDRLHEPILASVPQYMWRNQVATVYEAKRTGDKFLPLPGPYQVSKGEMVRGGQVVRTTDIEGLYQAVMRQEPSPSIALGRRNDEMIKAMKAMNSSSSIVGK